MVTHDDLVADFRRMREPLARQLSAFGPPLNMSQALSKGEVTLRFWGLNSLNARFSPTSYLRCSRPTPIAAHAGQPRRARRAQ